MPDDEKTLRCTPRNVQMYCETPSSTTVRVRTSDRAEGVSITAIGYDTSRVFIDPKSSVTNKQGFIEATVRCPGRGFCPTNTTITFTADSGDYEDCEINVSCENLAAVAVASVEAPGTGGRQGLASFLKSRGSSPDSHWVAAGDLHGAWVAQILKDREYAKGDQRVLIRQGLEKLSSLNCISAFEARTLAELTDVLTAEDKNAAVLKCRRVHQDLLLSDASPLALAISSIACDSVVSSIVLSVDVEGDIVGAVVGGVIGFFLGGPLIGALVGAALLSSAQPAR